MREKKPIITKSPDLNGMQAVTIDERTKIYIPRGADPQKARERFMMRLAAKKNG
jgi:hypothetical protein